MDLNKQILNWIKTKEVQQRMENKVANKSFVTNAEGEVIGNITSTSNSLDIELYIKDIEIFLREEINKLSSDRAKEIFLNAIIITKVEHNNGWSIGLNFDEDEVWSKSLWEKDYPQGAYLPTLFAMGYTAKKYVYGYNNHGVYIRSLKHREGYNFIKKAVEKFKIKYPNIKIEFNEIYGGDLPRGDIASGVF